MHKGAIKDNAPAVQAARKHGVAVAEIWYNDRKQSVGIALENSQNAGKSGSSKQISGSGSPKKDDVALLLHTSGTTGRPKVRRSTLHLRTSRLTVSSKAVPLTHANLLATHRNIVNTYKLTPEDRSFLVMPGFHVHGELRCQY